jgi:tetratricopeptide (TPR) repeat protein
MAIEAQALATGDRAYLDEAVRFLRAASDAGDGHPMWPMFRSNLSNVLMTRFDWMGAAADLDGAIEGLTDAVSATAPTHPDQPMYLSNLGAVRRARFRRHGDFADVDAAVESARAALGLTPDDSPAWPGRLANLGIALRARGLAEDLAEAVECCETAVRSQADDHPTQATLLSHLAGALLDRHRRDGDPADLADAVRRLRHAVRLTPAGHPAYGIYHGNLGYALTAAGETAEAADVCLTAAESATTPAVARLRAAWHASELLAGTAPARAAAAGRTATRLLPLVVPRALARPDQELMLGRLSGVARDAAALALAVPGVPLGDAVEALETGRVVLLGQIRDEHPDLTRLRARRPDLADRLKALATLLGSPVPRVGSN